MNFFGNLTQADRVHFEGCEVWNITTKTDSETKEITHYALAIYTVDDAKVRKFRPEEIRELIKTERLVIDRGYYSLKRVEDRRMHGRKEIYFAGKKRRETIGRKAFLAQRMAHCRREGMTLTRQGVDQYRARLEADYKQFQVRTKYGTEKANASQSLHPLPANDTLLGYLRKFEKSGGDPNVFNVQRRRSKSLPVVDDNLNFVLHILQKYAQAGPSPYDELPTGKSSKREIAERAVDAVAEENLRRLDLGRTDLIPTRSTRTYERYIDLYLDPFTVAVQREGLAKATRDFGTTETGLVVGWLGETVQFDAWQFHIVSLDTTRAEFDRMTADERKRVKRVRRWVVVAIDVASRVILGHSICRSPNQNSSIEALRMCFMDKTYLLRCAGIHNSHWNYVCPIGLVSTDSGSEFGKHPFGGSEFAGAVKRLRSSFMNTTAGVASLRGHIERFFRTCELGLARQTPGWTASKPSKLNDRKPYDEACITDDELHQVVVAFFAKYHSSSHRGLNGKTPATVWEELSKGHSFDETQLPGPQDLREACGYSTTAKITQEGIRYAGAIYHNKQIRDDRLTPQADRIASPDGGVNIIVDPRDMGAISIVDCNDTFAVPALDETMRGKTLREWQDECQMRRAEADADRKKRRHQRDEADRVRAKITRSAMRKSDIGLCGYRQTEIDRARLELTFGKGSNEEPYIGRDEYQDPVYGGFETAEPEPAPDEDEPIPEDQEDEHGVNAEVQPDGPGSMDRFRTKKKFSS